MNETWFDALRRALVAVSPRRGLMSLLGGLTLGGAVPALLETEDAQAKDKKKVRANKKKKKAKSTPGPEGPAGAQGPGGPQGPAGSITCPSGTLLHAAACIETTKRSNNASFATARDTCLAAGRRLPTVAEMETFRTRSGTDVSGTQEYTSHIWRDGAENLVLQIGNTGIASTAGQGSSLAFRCVADPS